MRGFVAFLRRLGVANPGQQQWQQQWRQRRVMRQAAALSTPLRNLSATSPQLGTRTPPLPQTPALAITTFFCNVALALALALALAPHLSGTSPQPLRNLELNPLPSPKPPP